MRKTIYIDLDGVVADFVLHYEIFYKAPISDRDLLDENKKTFSKNQFFLNLPVIEEGIKLVKHLDTLNADIKILTAVGDNDISENTAYKAMWVIKNIGGHKFHWVKKSNEKAVFAHENAFLVDDREKSLDPFLDAGGNGFLFENGCYDEVIEKIELFLED